MNGVIAFIILLSTSCLNRPALALSRNTSELIIAAPLHQPAKRFMYNSRNEPQIINPKKKNKMKSTLNRTSKLALLNVSAKGNQVITTSPVKKNVVFEVVLEEGMTSRPFLIVYEKGIDPHGLSNARKTEIQPQSTTGNSYILELKDQSKPLYFSLLLTGYLMDITIAREFHFEPGDHIKIEVHKTDVPNIYDLDFSGRASGKYRCQNEFLYAVETDTVKVLPEVTKNNYYNKNNRSFRYTNMLYDLIEKYQPEMSDYSYHLLHADVLGNMGRHLLTDLQVKLYDQLKNKDTVGFRTLAKSFSDQYLFDFVRDIPDSVLFDSKEYALFMIERIKTKVLIDFETVNYAIVYERIKKVDNPVLRDKMIAALFNYYIRLEDDNGSMIIDALSVVKTKECKETLGNIF